MKLLLTSAGITNDSIRKALGEMLGKPITASKAVFIPSGVYAYPKGSAYAWQMLREHGEMGWQEFGVLELTALPSLLEEHWLPDLQAADVIWVGGGNTLYLSYWMHESGLAEKLPELLKNACMWA
jgi:dipeptidase E